MRANSWSQFLNRVIHRSTIKEEKQKISYREHAMRAKSWSQFLRIVIRLVLHYLLSSIFILHSSLFTWWDLCCWYMSEGPLVFVWCMCCVDFDRWVEITNSLSLHVPYSMFIAFLLSLLIDESLNLEIEITTSLSWHVPYRMFIAFLL